MARGAGLDDLERRIKAMPAAAREEISKALDVSAEEVADTARLLAPSDDGDLRSSIRTGRGAHELSRTIEAGGPTTTRPVREGVSATYDYALGTEWGTADTRPQPYFFPAWRLGRKRAKGRIARAVRKAAKAAGWSA